MASSPSSMPASGQVFISFASHDVEVADRFVFAIEAGGLSCWIAHRDIPPGTSYPAVITSAIHRAGVMLVVVTEAANASPHVLREVEMAFNAGKPILPVRFSNVELSPSLTYFLSTKQWLDAGADFDDGDAARVLQGLRDLLAAPEPRHAPEHRSGGAQRGGRPWLVPAALALLLVIAGVAYVALRPSPGEAPSASAAPPVAVPAAGERPAPSGSASSSSPAPASPAESATPPVAGNSEGAASATPPASNLPEPRRAFRVHPVSGQTYMWIPAGEFTMGCSQGDTLCDADEQPAHQVTIARPFWIGRTEVTGAQYRAIVKSGDGSSAAPDSPITDVTWADAKAYCKAAGGRLPTEAEWEYAARAGAVTKAYGALDAISWFARNSEDHAHKVGTLKANRFGLFDMLGNVHEWVLDRYFNKYDEDGEDTGVIEPVAPNASAVVRGGAWTSMAKDVRLSARLEREPGATDPNVGFRCVMD